MKLSIVLDLLSAFDQIEYAFMNVEFFMITLMPVMMRNLDLNAVDDANIFYCARTSLLLCDPDLEIRYVSGKRSSRYVMLDSLIIGL
jgi:hypothetical protein